MTNAKKKSIGVLTGLFGLTMCFAIPTAISASAAEGDDTATTTITMEAGASIRLDGQVVVNGEVSENKSGLKFTATVENAKEGADYGMLIVPADYLTAEMKAENYSGDYIADLKKANKSYLESKTLTPDENGKISYSIVNLYDHNFNREFLGVAFERTTTTEGTTYTYAAVNDNYRSVMEIASAALNDLYYNASLADEYKNMYTTYEETLKTFVQTGVKNAVGESTDFYAIEGGDVAKLHSNVKLDLNIAETKNLHLQTVWSSSDEKVATVDENGVITTVGVGEATITANCGELYEATKTITVEKMTAAETVDALYTLKENDALPGTHTLTGVINSVDYAYSASTGAVSVTIIVEGKTEQPIYCYKLKGDGADLIAENDTITVTGVLKDYNGTKEFDNGCTLVDIPAAKKVTATWNYVLAEVPSTILSNDITIDLKAINEGKPFDDVEISWANFVENEVATISDNVISFVRGETDATVEIPFVFTCGTETKSETITITVNKDDGTLGIDVTIAALSQTTWSADEWVYQELVKKDGANEFWLDEEGRVVVSYPNIKDNQNTGKAYADNSEVRFYATENATIKVSIDEGYMLTTVALTLSKGTVTYANEVYTSGTDVEVNAISATFVVTENATLTGIKVVYKEAKITDEQKVATTVNEVTSLSIPQDAQIGEKIEGLLLNGVTYEKVGITWKKDGVDVEGSSIEILQTDAGKTIELTATVGLGEATKTVTFKIDVAATVTIPENVTYELKGSGVQYADEEYVLDAYIQLNTYDAHYTTQLRLYDSNSHDSTAVITSKTGTAITQIDVNAGNSVATLNIYGSTDGTNWTLIQAVTTTSAYADHTVEIENSSYTYLKLDADGAQIRVKTMTIYFAQPAAEEAQA